MKAFIIHARSTTHGASAGVEAFFNLRDAKPCWMHWKNSIDYMREEIRKGWPAVSTIHLKVVSED